MPKRRHRNRAFTLVEIMIVVLIIGVLLAIAVPNFLTARQGSRAATIVANLREIDAAKEQCGMLTHLNVGDPCADYTPYLKRYPPVFPVAGALVEGPLGTFSTFKGKTADQWMVDRSGL